MDFYEETEKRKSKFLAEIGELSYRRYLLCKEIENCEDQILELDRQISGRETAIREADQAQRNFNTYLAIKESAMTVDDLAQAIQDGGQPERPKKRKR